MFSIVSLDLHTQHGTPSGVFAFLASGSSEIVSLLACLLVVKLLRAAARGCPKAFAHTVGSGDFMQVVLKSMASPVVADDLMGLVKELRRAVFDTETDHLAQVSQSNISNFSLSPLFPLAL